MTHAALIGALQALEEITSSRGRSNTISVSCAIPNTRSPLQGMITFGACVLIVWMTISAQSSRPPVVLSIRPPRL